jgi:serine/threonine protein kinase
MTFQERYQYNPQTDLLGKGGFAHVYRATDTLLNRVVALKFFINQSDDKYTLIKEISKVIELDHPNLCRYYDATLLEIVNIHGQTDKAEVGIIELMDGGDLKTFVKLYPSQLDKLLIDVLQGLSFLHENGIIHRDLKTQNILIKNTSRGAIAKITDFGISKTVTTENNSSSALMGTIEYMAPEQFNPIKYGINGKINTNVDLWSFGVLVYELVTNQKLFGSLNGETSAEQVMSNILSDSILNEKLQAVKESYKTIIQKCLIKHANKRVRSANDLINIIKASKFFNANNKAETTIYDRPSTSNAETQLINLKQIETNELMALVNKTSELSLFVKPGFHNTLYSIIAFGYLALIILILCVGSIKPIMTNEIVTYTVIFFFLFSIAYWQIFLRKFYLWVTIILLQIILSLIVILILFKN